MAQLRISEDKALYRKILAENTFCLPIFYQPFWLDATASPENWQVRIVLEKNQPICVFPFVLKHKWGLPLIRKPLFTPFLGIKFPSVEIIRPYKWLNQSKAAIHVLLESLPKALHIQIVCSSPFAAGAVMQWAGFRQNVRYFNVLDLEGQPEECWLRLSKSLRKQIRGSEQYFKSTFGFSVDRYYQLQQAVFERQQLPIPFSRGQVARVVEQLEKRKIGGILEAVDEDKLSQSSRLLLLDPPYCYSLGLGTNLGRSGREAGKFLTWRAIQLAKSRGCQFLHFGGSMIEGVYEFNTSFGAEAVPYYEFTRCRNRLWRLSELFQK